MFIVFGTLFLIGVILMVVVFFMIGNSDADLLTGDGVFRVPENVSCLVVESVGGGGGGSGETTLFIGTGGSGGNYPYDLDKSLMELPTPEIKAEDLPDAPEIPYSPTSDTTVPKIPYPVEFTYSWDPGCDCDLCKSKKPKKKKKSKKPVAKKVAKKKQTKKVSKKASKKRTK